MKARQMRKLTVHALCYQAKARLFQQKKIPMRLVAKVKKELTKATLAGVKVNY